MLGTPMVYRASAYDEPNVSTDRTGVSHADQAKNVGTITYMAGRPKKDPDGLVGLNFAVPGRLREAVRDGAREHGLSMVDYLAALVAAERHDPNLGPALQEVIDLADTA